MNLAPDVITYIGRTNHRGSDQLFGIRQADRRMHMLILGKTGTGKSHLLKLIAAQDITAGRGIAIFDPHGDLALAVRGLIPAEQEKTLIYVDPADASSVWRFNPFFGVPAASRSLAASGIVSVFKKIWRDEWGPRLEHLLRNVAFALLEREGSSFADVPLLLLDKTFRLELARNLTNPAVRHFWSEEFEKYGTTRPAVIAPLQNKVGALLTDPVLRRFFTEEGERLDLASIMDESRVLVVNLDKGRLGEDSATLVGSILLSHIALAGIARSPQLEAERRDFAVLLDEFQLFTTQATANMLAELRKYRVSVIVATQYLGAIEPPILDAVLGNAGTIISFRIGADDAARITRELGTFSATDFTNLPRYNVYVRLLIDGEPSRAFSATIPASVGPEEHRLISTEPTRESVATLDVPHARGHSVLNTGTMPKRNAAA